MPGHRRIRSAALDRYGRDLGVAFQIADDVLDIWGEERVTGKSLGTDLEKQKLTLPVIRLLRRSRPRATDDRVRRNPDRSRSRSQRRAATRRYSFEESGALDYAWHRAKQHAQHRLSTRSIVSNDSQRQIDASSCSALSCRRGARSEPRYLAMFAFTTSPARIHNRGSFLQNRNSRSSPHRGDIVWSKYETSRQASNADGSPRPQRSKAGAARRSSAIRRFRGSFRESRVRASTTPTGWPRRWASHSTYLADETLDVEPTPPSDQALARGAENCYRLAQKIGSAQVIDDPRIAPVHRLRGSHEPAAGGKPMIEVEKDSSDDRTALAPAVSACWSPANRVGGGVNRGEGAFRYTMGMRATDPRSELFPLAARRDAEILAVLGDRAPSDREAVAAHLVDDLFVGQRVLLVFLGDDLEQLLLDRVPGNLVAIGGRRCRRRRTA